jgi:hypothetical protein
VASGDHDSEFRLQCAVMKNQVLWIRSRLGFRRRTWIAAGVTLVAIAVGVWLYFELTSDIDDPDPRGGPLAGEMRFLPNSTTALSVYQYDVARSYPAFAELQNCRSTSPRAVGKLFQAGIAPDIIRAVVVTQPVQMSVLTLRREISPEKFFGAWTLERTNSSRYRGGRLHLNGEKGFLISPKHIVIGDSKVIGDVLDGPLKGPLSNAMQAAITMSDFDKPELHLETMTQFPEGGAFGVSEGTKRDFSMQFLFGLMEGKSPATILTDVDYQSPMNLRVRIFSANAADAKNRAKYFMESERAKVLGPLSSPLVEVKDTTVTLRKIIQPCDMINVPTVPD